MSPLKNVLYFIFRSLPPLSCTYSSWYSPPHTSLLYNPRWYYFFLLDTIFLKSAPSYTEILNLLLFKLHTILSFVYGKVPMFFLIRSYSFLSQVLYVCLSHFLESSLFRETNLVKRNRVKALTLTINSSQIHCQKNHPKNVKNIVQMQVLSEPCQNFTLDITLDISH